MKKKETNEEIPLFDDGEASKNNIDKKPKKKLKQKTWILIKGWTRDNQVMAIHEISDTDIAKFSNLIKAIKSCKGNNWDADLNKVYEKYPKIKSSVIDEFEAYIPSGIDLCYMDESRTIISSGCADTIDSVIVIRGTEDILFG
jgi:hypothetical protein